MMNKRGYSKSFFVKPLSFARGLLLVWNPNKLNLQVVSHSSQVIHNIVSKVGSTLRITFAYVWPSPAAKERLWHDIKTYADNIYDPWILLGDLNDIGSMDE